MKELIVSNNNLTEVPVDMTMSSLEAVDVTNNPIREIDCDVEQLSHLKKITFGSNQTWFVSARVLNRICGRKANFTCSRNLQKLFAASDMGDD